MNEDEVRRFLKYRLKEQKLTCEQFGAICHVAKQTVWDATSGRRPPSKRILKQLGLKRVVTVTYEFVFPVNTPVKTPSRILTMHGYIEE